MTETTRNLQNMLTSIKELTASVKALKQLESGMNENLRNANKMPPELKDLGDKALKALKEGNVKYAGEIIAKLQKISVGL